MNTHYNLSRELMVAVVNLLSAMPAGQSRAVLNAIDVEVAQQDEAHRAAAREALMKDIRQEVESERKGGPNG